MHSLISTATKALIAIFMFAASAGLVSAQPAARTISPNCVIYAVSEKFDFQQQPLWLNLALNPDESRFYLRPVAKKIMRYFADQIQARDKELYFVAFPDTAQFAPFSNSQMDKYRDRFAQLYSDMNRQMEESGFQPVNMMEIARENRQSGKYHRDLDHHLTSRGRYLLAAEIAKIVDEGGQIHDANALNAAYSRFPKEEFKVWKPSALNFTIDQCKDEVDQMLFDELVELPKIEATEEVDSSSLFGAAPAGDRFALMGTSQSLSADGNLASMITHFTGIEGDNFSEAGGGASMALQMAAAEGVFSDPSYGKLIWEVFSDYDEERLVGAALSGLGMEPDACADGKALQQLASISGNYGGWTAISDLPQKQGLVLSLPNEAHTKGIVTVRFDFPDGDRLEAEIWRWSPQTDPARLGAWNILVPDFSALGLQVPEAIFFQFKGLYEYQPTGNLSLTPSWCPAKR